MFYHTDHLVTFAGDDGIARDRHGHLWGLYPIWLPIRDMLAFPFFARYPSCLLPHLSTPLVVWQGRA